MCLALRASGLWLRYATLQNWIPSFPWIAPPRPPPWHNPRKGRDPILPSGNTGMAWMDDPARRRRRCACRFSCAAALESLRSLAVRSSHPSPPTNYIQRRRFNSLLAKVGETLLILCLLPHVLLDTRRVIPWLKHFKYQSG